MKHIDPIGRQSLRRYRQGVGSVGDKTPLDAVGNVGELDATVPDWAAAEPVEEMCLRSASGAEYERVAGEQAGETVTIGNDLGVGSEP